MTSEGKKHFRVALFGAPCSGKTSVLEDIRNKVYSYPDVIEYYTPDCPGYLNQKYWDKVDAAFLREEDGIFPPGEPAPDFLPIHIIQEAWEKYRGIGEVALSVSRGERSLESLSVIWNINLNRDDYYLKPYPLSALYEKLGLRAFTQPIPSEAEMKVAIQQDLLRIQLYSEMSEPWEWLKDREYVSLVDGGFPYILSYWPALTFSEYAKVFQEQGLAWQSMEETLQFYDAIILLETLAMLSPAEYEPHFSSKGRLDSPEHAREVHGRLLSLVESHPRHLILKAETPPEVKQAQVLQYVQTLPAVVKAS